MRVYRRCRCWGVGCPRGGRWCGAHELSLTNHKHHVVWVGVDGLHANTAQAIRGTDVLGTTYALKGDKPSIVQLRESHLIDTAWRLGVRAPLGESEESRQCCNPVCLCHGHLPHKLEKVLRTAVLHRHPK